MAARPKKLSKFKSDRTATSSLLPPDSRSSGGGGGGVVLGGIVEARDTSAAPLAALSCSAAASTGFPPYARAGKTLSLGASVSRSGSRRKPCPVTSSTLQHRDESFDCNDSDVSSEDFSSLNMKRVANMSEEDVQRALREISASISADNLNFLKVRGEKELRLMSKDSVSECRIENIDKETVKDRMAFENASIVDIKHQTSRSTEKLTDTMSGSSRNVQGKILPVRLRFDLSGRRIVNKTDLLADWLEVLKNSFLVHELPVADVQDIANYCVDATINSEFVLSLEEHADREEQEDNVQQASNTIAVGYTLPDACKFMCSEVKSQRLVGLKILNGAMSKRDVISSSESYSVMTLGCKVVNKRHSSTTAIPPYQLFGDILSYIVNKLQSTKTTDDRMVEGTSVRCLPPFLTENLHRVLTFALLKTCCADDFPPEVAYLIQWNISVFSPLSAHMYQLHSLKSASYFMFSGLECCIGDHVLWSGVWGLYGIPFRFMTPLTRRPECSYATHANSCIRKHSAAKADNALNEAERDRSQRSGDSASDKPPLSGIAVRPYEEFAVLCRWRRVDVMFDVKEGGDNFMTSLHRIIDDSLSQITSVCHWYSEQKISFFDDIQRGDEDVLMAADVLIWSMKLLTYSIRGCDIATVEVVQKAIFMTIWPKLVTLFTFCVSHGLLFPIKKCFKCKAMAIKLKSICTWMWKFAAEIARRSFKYAEIICTHSSEVLNLIITMEGMSAAQASSREGGSESESRNVFDDAEYFINDASDQTILLWALRFWRCCASYRISSGATLNLMLQLYAQVERFGILFSEIVHIEVLELLEEITVSCSVFFLNRARLASPTFVGVSINDIVYLDLCRIVFQVMAVMVRTRHCGKIYSNGNRRIPSVNCSYENFFVSVVGIDPSVLSSIAAPLRSLWASHIRGLGLCAAVDQFAALDCDIATGNDQSNLPIADNEGKLQTSLSGLKNTIVQLKTLFVDMIERVHITNGEFCCYDMTFGDSSSTLKMKKRKYLEFQCCLSQNLLALSYFSILLRPENMIQSSTLGVQLLCRIIMKGDLWIRSNEVHNENSVTAGLYSVKVQQVFLLTQLTHAQLFSLAFSHIKKFTGAISNKIATWFRQKGVTYVLRYMSSLSPIVPFTAYRCLHAVLTYTTASVISVANVAVDHDLKVLVNEVLKAAYGIKNKSELSSSDKVEIDGEDTNALVNIMNVVSSPEHSVSSTFLYIDNNFPLSSFETYPYLVNEVLTDNILCSSFSKLCRVDRHWMLCAMASLRGLDLHLWVRVLRDISGEDQPQDSNSLLTDSHHLSVSKIELFNAYESVEDIAQGLYWLARLPASNIVTFWGKPKTLEESLAADPLSPLVEHYEGLILTCYRKAYAEKVKWTLQRPVGDHCLGLDIFAEVGDFLEIISSTQNKSLFMSSKVSQSGPEELNMEADIMTRMHIQSKIRNRGRSTPTTKGQVKKCTGVEDLCERLMDGLVNQAYHFRIHAAAVSFILIPGILPWIFRGKMWRTLGEMKLLHLVESPLLKSSLIMFLELDVLLANYISRQEEQKSCVKSSQSVAVVVAMVDAILQLRQYKEERDLEITRIALFSISYYIFNDMNCCKIISGLKETLLMRLIDDHAQISHNLINTTQNDDHVCKEGGNSISSALVDVLKISSVLLKTEDIVGGILVKTEILNDVAPNIVTVSTAISGLWQEALSPSTGLWNEPSCAANCLQYSVGRDNANEGGGKKTLIDILRNRCPDIVKSCMYM